MRTSALATAYNSGRAKGFSIAGVEQLDYRLDADRTRAAAKKPGMLHTAGHTPAAAGTFAAASEAAASVAIAASAAAAELSSAAGTPQALPRGHSAFIAVP